jgi:dipeptidyl aminopeptidase/acylaminoacyl peptidase
MAKRNLFTLVSLVLVLTAAEAFSQEAKTNPPARIYRDKVEPHWFTRGGESNSAFWYRVSLAGDKSEFVLVDALKGTRQPAFDAARVAEALGKLLSRTVSPDRLPVNSLEFDSSGKSVMLKGEADWTLDLESYAITQVSGGEGAKGLPKTTQVHPSRDGGAETQITFVNRMKEDVNIFWVDGNGDRVPYGSLKPEERREQHTFAGHVWLAMDRGGAVVAVFDAGETAATAFIEPATQGQPQPRQRRRPPQQADRATYPGLRSPDGKWEALVHGHNLFLKEVKSEKEMPLTYDANPTSSYARNEEANRAIEMEYDKRDPESPTPEVYWSPDSRYLVAMRMKPGTSRRVYLIESSPKDQLQPRLDSYPYLKPGDDVPVRKPHLFLVEGRKEIAVSDALFANPWSLDDLRWSADSSRFTFLFNQRGHQALRVLAVDAASGAVRPIVDEESKTFICYSGKFFSEYLDDTGEIIWMSERDGWNHLYLYDAKTGTVKNQITRGEWVVRKVERVDKEKRQVWFQTGGIRAGQDPYYLHLCRVNFDGTGLTVLTEGDGTHSVQFSPDRRWLIDTWSRVDAPPVNELRNAADGKLVCALETADAAEWLASGTPVPERFVAKARDSKTDIYGVIWRPKGFDAAKKYPVIENIYAGPQDSFAPKEFRPSFQQQRLANFGFIVVMLDGMGTANRSKAFHDVCYKNLGDAGFPDRVLWIKAAGAKYPAFDLDRVGLYGTSAGGQDALRGLLDYGDFYKAGLADSGCHDNRMDKIWWNEQWMGWPVDESYVRSSNVADAHKLHSKFMIFFGELDRNVDPASSMQVVNALIKSEKDFEMLEFPGAGHGVAYSPYGFHRLVDFFTRSLKPGQM